MTTLRGELVAGSIVGILRDRHHSTFRRRRRKACVHVQNGGHGDGERADELNQALASQELHETQSHTLTKANFVVHAVSAGRYTIMLMDLATF